MGLPLLCGELVRTVTRDVFVHVLSGSWPREAEGIGVDDVEDPMARSDLTRGNTAGSASLPSTGSVSLLALLRARFFHFAERNFRMATLDGAMVGGAIEGSDRSIANEG